MESKELLRLRAAIVREPGNAELRYLLGAEARAAPRISRSRGADAHRARHRSPSCISRACNSALLYLTMSQPDDSLAIWAPLEELDEGRRVEGLQARSRGADPR